jgi:hypothetical protein
MSDVLMALITEVKALQDKTNYLASKESDRRATSGTPIYSALTAGRVVFAGTSKELDDDGALVWDNTSKRLGVGASPGAFSLDVTTSASTARARIKSSATDGFGGLQLENDARAWLFQVQGSDGDKLFIVDSTAVATRLAIDSSGQIGIGTAAPGARLEIAGDVLASSNIRATGGRLEHITAGQSAKLDLFTAGNIGYVGTGTNHPLIFRTNDTNRGAIDTSGNFGIGTTGPGQKLHVVDAAAAGQDLESSNTTGYARLRFVTNTRTFGFVTEGSSGGTFPGRLALYDYSSAATVFNVNSSQYTRFGDATTAAYRIELPNSASVAGQGRANAWVTYSSRTRKRNVRNPNRAAWRRLVKALQAVEWEPEDGDGTDLGLIAEDVIPIAPNLVTGDPEKPETLAIKYDRVGVVLLPAVQDHDERIDTLEAENMELKQQLTDMLSRLAALERSSNHV